MHLRVIQVFLNVAFISTSPTLQFSFDRFESRNTVLKNYILYKIENEHLIDQISDYFRENQI